jgi:hypothetical protein
MAFCVRKYLTNQERSALVRVTDSIGGHVCGHLSFRIRLWRLIVNEQPLLLGQSDQNSNNEGIAILVFRTNAIEIGLPATLHLFVTRI